MEEFDNAVKRSLSFLDNEYVSAAVALFLILYAGLAAPKLPEWVARLFDNMLFKLVVFFMIVYVSRKNATIAIIAAVAVMVSLMTLNKLKWNQEMMTVVNGGSVPVCEGGNCSVESDESLPSVVTLEDSSSGPVAKHTYEELPHVEEVRDAGVGSAPQEVVQQVLDAKAEQEDALGRKLSHDELKALCQAHVDSEDVSGVEGYGGGESYSRPL